jgi:phosphoglycerol transferase MdoB-like AlkP superfamily enzyme
MKTIYSILAMVLIALFWDSDFHVIRGLLNLFPGLICFVFLLFLTNSWFVSTIAITFITAGCYLLSFIKLKVWRQPVSPADLHYLHNPSDLWGVLEVYTEPYVLIGLLILFVTLTVLFYLIKIDSKRDRFVKYAKGARGLAKRGLVTTIGVIILAIWVNQLINFSSPMHRIYHDFSTKHGMSQLKLSLQENGFFAYFISRLPLFEIQMPHFDMTMTSVQPTPVVEDKTARATVLPDIFVWVNESTFDPQYLKLDCSDMPHFKMFQDHPANIASGLLNVPTFGGRTWMTEFGFFAGIPPLIFGPGGSCAPYTLVPRLKEALGTHLRSRGYRTVALNPVSGRFMDTTSTYRRYGMDEFYEPKDLGAADPESWHIPDDFFKDHAIRVLQGHNGPMPLFLMVLTMGNHGPHGQNDSSEKSYCKSGRLSRKTARQLNDYLDRLEKTDMAIEALTECVLTRGRPTIFLYFGDHLPAFTDEIPDEVFDVEKGVDKMKTTFHIRTNYPVKHPVVPHILDVSFLSGLLLDVAQVNDSPFFRFNSFMRSHMNGEMPLKATSDRFLNSYIAQIVNQLKK